MLVKMGSSSPNFRGENKKYLKPPPSFGLEKGLVFGLKKALFWLVIFFRLKKIRGQLDSRYFRGHSE